MLYQVNMPHLLRMCHKTRDRNLNKSREASVFSQVIGSPPQTEKQGNKLIKQGSQAPARVLLDSS